MVEFKRKKGESFESFLRRFNKTLIRSRKLNEVRSRKYVQKKRNKNKQKNYALISKELREKKEYLKKIGKLKDEPGRRW
jgi:ribosomal protein S21